MVRTSLMLITSSLQYIIYDDIPSNMYKGLHANGSSGVNELITNGFHLHLQTCKHTSLEGGGGEGRGALPIVAYMGKLHSKGTFRLGYRYIKGIDDHIMD